MTDGVTLNQGVGGSVVDTEVSPSTLRHMQRVKLVLGAADVDSGDVAMANPMPTAAANPSTIVSGQQTCTASAVALPSQALVNGVVVKAKSINTGTVYVGPSGVTSSTGYPLLPGEAASYAVTNLSAIYILDATTTDGVSWTGN